MVYYLVWLSDLTTFFYNQEINFDIVMYLYIFLFIMFYLDLSFSNERYNMKNTFEI